MSKAEARLAAKIRRDAAHCAAQGADLTAHLRAALAPFAGARIAFYVPIGSEIDPLPAAKGLASVCLPVVVGKDQPLVFRSWVWGAPLEKGAYGAGIPLGGETVDPEVIVVPMLAFTRACHRLGYGGGYYDRTLAQRKARTIGFAYAAQETAHLPILPTDQALDQIVTERGVILPQG